MICVVKAQQTAHEQLNHKIHKQFRLSEQECVDTWTKREMHFVVYVFRIVRYTKVDITVETTDSKLSCHNILRKSRLATFLWRLNWFNEANVYRKNVSAFLSVISVQHTVAVTNSNCSRSSNTYI